MGLPDKTCMVGAQVGAQVNNHGVDRKRNGERIM